MFSKEDVAARYEQRKQDLGWYTDSPQVIPVGTVVQIDGPFGKFHEREAVVVFSIPRQVVVEIDGEQVVLGTPAVEVAATQEP